MDGIEEAKRYWGYFVLVSNEIKDPFDALKAYRSREKIEELFATYKDSFDGRKPRTWYPENLYGRQFAQFVGLGYHCFLAKRILDVKKALSEKETEGKTKEELSLEAKLLAWLNQHSLIQIWTGSVVSTTSLQRGMPVHPNGQRKRRDATSSFSRCWA